MNYETLADFQHVEPGAEIVSMVPYKDMILLATRQYVYVIKDGKISLMEFEIHRMANVKR